MDDDAYVQQNRQVQQGLTMHSIEWAFTTFYASNWHPLTWISHMVDWKLYGSNPTGHHVTNVYLHAANAILLFLLLLYMTGYLGRSAMVAFLFALHPAHVESVAWVAERKDVLSTFFWFAALLAYTWYVRRPSWKRYALVTCCFACGLMSKPMAVTLPFTLLLLDYWPLRRITFARDKRARWFPSLWKLCVEKWLLFLMAAISSVITYIAQQTTGAMDTFQILPMWERLCNAAISYCRFVRIMVWPDPLTAYYYYDTNNIRIWAAVLSAIALILVTAVCWHFRKQKPYCLIGWLWFLGTLLPVIGIVQVGGQAMAERYTYVPSIGLFIAFVWLVGDAVANFPKMRIVTQLFAVAIIVACAVKTDAQVRVWKDTVTLFTHILEVDPRGEFPNASLGVAYMREGKLDQAEDYFDRSLTYDSKWTQILSDSAFCLMRIAMQTHDQSKLALAKQRLEQALLVDPKDPGALTNLALWSALMGRPKNEEIYCRKLIAVNPNYITAWLYLGDALQAQGELDEAVKMYRRALFIEPDNYYAHYDLGNVLYKLGLAQDALNEYRLSLAIQPEQSISHSKIGKIFMETHQIPEAVEEFSQALQYDPANSNAHNDLGLALLQQGDYQKATEQFTGALGIDPANAEARKNLDLAHAGMKNKQIEHGRK
jgi:tetratricopeptide (TPR) repeat protein